VLAALLASALVLGIALAATGAHGPLNRFTSGPLVVGPGFTGDPTSSDRPCLGSGAPAVCATP
jgi:hypothetical protein